MLKVVIIGSGNVAHHLIQAFEKSAQIMLVQVYARNPEKLAHLLPEDRITGSLKSLADADIYIISVTDDAITEVSSQLDFSGKFVVHTSGSVSMEQINGKNRRGVLYPLQTFSKDKQVDFSLVPICLETEFTADYVLLDKLANIISGSVYRVDSEQRKALHVSAVFVSNFTNHMYAIGSTVCEQNDIPFDILKPLILETAAKIKSLTPLQAQTGPAIRNDRTTIKKHLEFLEDEHLREIYAILTKSIQQANVKKL